MAEKLLVLLGTNKGAFILESDGARRDWALRGPYCDAWPINHVVGDPATGAIFAAGGSPWHGLDVWRTDDLGESWTRSGAGLAFDEGVAPADSVWSLAAAGGRLYAGVRPVGLFESGDGGATWAPVRALNGHPTRPRWVPGGAGMTLHHIVADPAAPERLWVGISSAGVFHSPDGGASWEPRNRGVRSVTFEGETTWPELGQCVHGLALAPGGARLYLQSHHGAHRSDDGGRSWVGIGDGLPSSFGFPAAAHPRDPDTAWMIPLNGDVAGRYMPDARAAVWRTRDGGATWEDLRAGLPQRHVYYCVLRQALATDRLAPAGVYFGTNSGALYASADEGDSWRPIAEHLPQILSVETLAVAG